MKMFKRHFMHASMNYIDHVDYAHIVTAACSFGFRFKYWLSTIFFGDKYFDKFVTNRFNYSV
jgi:hypothetical protein